MKTKHTQGKWMIEKAIPQSNKLIDIKSNKIMVVTCNKRVITICGHEEKEEAIANAKLISAAPEMIEALIEVEKWAKSFGMGSIQYENVINAIKKATE